jgi:hypothetical protein
MPFDTHATRQARIQSSVHILKLVGDEVGGKSKKKGGAGYEANTYFMARDVTEKYQSQIHRPLER